MLSVESNSHVALDELSSARVWSRPLGRSVRIRVDGYEHAVALHDFLQREGFEGTALTALAGDLYLFTCLRNSHVTGIDVHSALRSAGVRLQLGPA